jgi:hypothetical protein
MLKTLSIVGYTGMIGGLLGLLVTRTLFSSSSLVILVQVLALLLFLWARVTFGRRSYHVVADPTEGGLVTGGRIGTSGIRSTLRFACSLRLGSGALVLERRLVRWVGFGQRGAANLLRGVPGGGTLSRVRSILSQDLAHDPLCLLRLRFQMGRPTMRCSEPGHRAVVMPQI